MKVLYIALLSILPMTALAHSILPLPSEDIEAVTVVSELTFEDFIQIKKVEASNESCAEDAWAFGNAFAAGYTLCNGYPPSSLEVYNATDGFYNNCVNYSGNPMLHNASLFAQ